MLQGKKARLLQNEAKDTVSAFFIFGVERNEDLSEAWGEMYHDEFVSDMREIMRPRLEEQHVMDCDDGLYDDIGMHRDDDCDDDGATGDNPKPLDFYDDQELYDMDEYDDDFFPVLNRDDGATVDNPKPLDYSDHRELCDPDEEVDEEEYFDVCRISWEFINK